LPTDVICASERFFEGDCDLYFSVQLDTMNQKLITVKKGTDGQTNNIVKREKLEEASY
jgi:hypothetical protein